MPRKKVTITVVSSDCKVYANPGQNLMEALTGANIFLRTDCGGRGTCGKCSVRVMEQDGIVTMTKACQYSPEADLSIDIPDKSMLAAHIIKKAPLHLPKAFQKKFSKRKARKKIGLAADLGTTTIGLYLCDIHKGKILSSLAVKNPQFLYGDDVMSRIGAINKNRDLLRHLQKLVVNAIEWGMKKMMASVGQKKSYPVKSVVVGNPAMIHILLGVDPESIGIFPYQPAFNKARQVSSRAIGFSSGDFPIRTLPQISGFIGGDIISAAIAGDLASRPAGTLLIDLGTNGELMLKANTNIFATSCATGPAFEGASIDCGIQAVPGAVDNILITKKNLLPQATCIPAPDGSTVRPAGICGTGVISAVSQLWKNKMIESGGALIKLKNSKGVVIDSSGRSRFIIVPQGSDSNHHEIYLSQKDIRSVQLGKSAMRTGIDLLLNHAGLDAPENVLVAGAFGNFLDLKDLIQIGMIPEVLSANVQFVGNAAGSGAVMSLCDSSSMQAAVKLADNTTVIDLAGTPDFQDCFINNLSF